VCRGVNVLQSFVLCAFPSRNDEDCGIGDEERSVVSGSDRVFHRVAHAFVVIFRVDDVSAL
jgi:hypothetical protein